MSSHSTIISDFFPGPAAVVGPFTKGIPVMSQYTLDRGVGTATLESVGEIDGFDFSLLAMSPMYPITVPAQRRRYPLRVSPEARKRKPPRRRTKISAKPLSVVRANSG